MDSYNKRATGFWWCTKWSIAYTSLFSKKKEKVDSTLFFGEFKWVEKWEENGKKMGRKWEENGKKM
jgi:hypothetical protein